MFLKRTCDFLLCLQQLLTAWVDSIYLCFTVFFVTQILASNKNKFLPFLSSFLGERALSEGNLDSREELGSSCWAGWSSSNFPWCPVSPLGPWLLWFWVVGKREDGGGFEHGFWAGMDPAWMSCPAPIVGSGLWMVQFGALCLWGQWLPILAHLGMFVGIDVLGTYDII